MTPVLGPIGPGNAPPQQQNLFRAAIGPFRRAAILRSRWRAAEIAPPGAALAVQRPAQAVGLAQMGSKPACRLSASRGQWWQGPVRLCRSRELADPDRRPQH